MTKHKIRQVALSHMTLMSSVLAVLAVSVLATTAWASGIGPVGICAMGGSLVLVAEKRENAVILVDVGGGGEIARRSLDAEGGYAADDATTWPDAVGVGSCETCAFAWVTTNRGARLYKLGFNTTLGEDPTALRRASLRAATAGTSVLVEPRMVAVERGGRRAYVAEHEAEGGGVYAFDPRHDDPVLTKLFQWPKATSVSLWYAAGSGLRLLVTGRWDRWPGLKKDRVGDPSGAKIAIVDVRNGTAVDVVDVCESYGSLRDALYDDTSRSFLVLGHPNRKGMVLGAVGASEFFDARLRHKRRVLRPSSHGFKTPAQARPCGTIVAGDHSSGSGWTDAEAPGRTSRFSRPHAMALLPGGTHVALTDIDNRAIRVVTLAPPSRRGSTRTVLYESRDAVLGDVGPACSRGAAANGTELVFHAMATAAAAEAHCASRGEALCDSDRAPNNTRSSWTAKRCASCWISSDVFTNNESFSWRKCSQNLSLDDLPAVARDNYKKPGGWDGGRLALRRGPTGAVATCVADPGDKRPYACCPPCGLRRRS